VNGSLSANRRMVSALPSADRHSSTSPNIIKNCYCERQFIRQSVIDFSPASFRQEHIHLNNMHYKHFYGGSLLYQYLCTFAVPFVKSTTKV
jgi:hypothetical protein